jgi:ribonuclease HI
MIHEDEYQSPLTTHMFIQSFLRDLAISCPNKVSVKKGSMPRPPKWIPPAAGCVKLNVDAALAKSRTGGAVAVVCRSEQWGFMGASSLTVDGLSDPAVLEAMACREALALVQDMQLQKITVASDCLSVINNLSTTFCGSYSMVLEEIKETASQFAVASLRHENRVSNSEAHRLARFATSSSVGRQLWLVQPPDGLCIPNDVIIQ